MTFSIRPLAPPDAQEFQDLRLEGFRLQEREFRYAPEDEAELALAEVSARLSRDFIVGAFSDGQMIGIAGLACHDGVKIRHKALLWGMYVRAEFRGTGVADMLMSAILDRARGQVELINLTVMHENRRAVRFYERWGFATYGIEPKSVKLTDGAYLDEALMSRRLD
jgi:ribosomal protein S18 acetylase RimI-like enzyme